MTCQCVNDDLHHWMAYDLLRVSLAEAENSHDRLALTSIEFEGRKPENMIYIGDVVYPLW